MLPLKSLVTFGLSFLICKDLNEMILCWLYTCSLHAYYIRHTTLKLKGYEEKDIVPTLKALFSPLNNCGSLIAWIEFPFIKDLELT